MFKDDIKKKAFWFVRAQVKKEGIWPFRTKRYVEDLSRVITDDFYGDAFSVAKLDTAEQIAGALGTDLLRDRLASGAIAADMRESYSLLAHGFNTNAILGKVRNSQINQAVYKPKLANFPDMDTPILDHNARVANDEPVVTIPEFMRLITAERSINNPRILELNMRKPMIDPAIGYGTPLLENSIPLRMYTAEFDDNNSQFDTIMSRISNQVGIDIRADSNLGEKEIKLTPKRFFGPLDTIKRVISRRGEGMNATGWPKRFTLSYPADNTNTEKLYAVLKCLSAIQVGNLAEMSRQSMEAYPTATNLPSLEAFDFDRGRLTSAASCLVASDLCFMLRLPTEQARLMSDTFKLEAYEHLMQIRDKDNQNYMSLIADYHAIAINNYAKDFGISIEDYAKSKGIEGDQALNIHALIYANNVKITPREMPQDDTYERLSEALKYFFDQAHAMEQEAGRTGEDTEEQEEVEEEEINMEDILTEFFSQEAFQQHFMESQPQQEEEKDPNEETIDPNEEKPEEEREPETQPLSDEELAQIFGDFFGGKAYQQTYQQDKEEEERMLREVFSRYFNQDEFKQHYETTELTDAEKQAIFAPFFNQPEFKQEFVKEPELTDSQKQAAFAPFFNQEEFKTVYEQTVGMTEEEMAEVFGEFFARTAFDRKVVAEPKDNYKEMQATLAPFFNQDEFKPEYKNESMTDSQRKAAFAPFFNQDEFDRALPQQVPVSDTDKMQAFAPFFNQDEFKQEYKKEAELTDSEKMSKFAPFFNQDEFKTPLEKEGASEQEVAQSLDYFFNGKEDEPQPREKKYKNSRLDDFDESTAGQTEPSQEEQPQEEEPVSKKDESGRTASNATNDGQNGGTGVTAGEDNSQEGDKCFKKTNKPKKIKPILKVTKPERLSPGQLPEGKLPKYRTNAGRECREFLYELVMEYSMEQLKETAGFAKAIKSTKDKEQKQELMEHEAEAKGKSSVGSVAGAILYSVARNTSLAADYNAKNFPRESEAVRKIDRLTHHIIEEVKQFARENPDEIKGDNVSVKKINQYFETLGALDTTEKASRAQRIVAGREIVKETLRDVVYDILNGVTLPSGDGESKDVADLRDKAERRVYDQAGGGDGDLSLGSPEAGQAKF